MSEEVVIKVETKRTQINEILHFLQEKMMPTIIKEVPDAEPIISASLGDIALIIGKAEDACNSDLGFGDRASAVAAAVASLMNFTEHICEFANLNSAQKRAVTGTAMVCLYDRIDKGHDGEKDRVKLPLLSEETSDTVERGAVRYGLEIAVAVYNMFKK